MIEFHYIPSGEERLAASLDLPSGGGPFPVVVVVHGLTGNRVGRSYHLVEFARRLNERGIACVRFDQAGCGESTGRFQDLTIPRMVDDVVAAAEWARAAAWCDAERLAYTALSLGGLATTAAEARTGSRALALWAPVFDMPRVFGATSKSGLRALLEHQGWVPYRGLRVGRGFIDQLAACDTSQLLTHSRAPVRVYHSDVDDVVSIVEGRAYVARCAEIGRPCELVRFTAADHDFGDNPDRERLLSDTVHFLSSHLLDQAHLERA